MLIGILETGRVADDLVATHGNYFEIFRTWLAGATPDVQVRGYVIVDGELPASPTECDAWVITGSKHGVYDDLPWIEPLKQFLRDARDAGRPIVGVCFGHQIMAEAFGGKAVKSDKGWGVGIHDYEVKRRTGWMEGGPDDLAIHAFHQDQVTAIPEDATVLASSPFCEYAMLAYGDPENPDGISIQPHPEFTLGYARDLLDRRAGVVVPPEVAEAAKKSFSRQTNDRDFTQWCIDYLRRALERRAAA